MTSAVAVLLERIEEPSALWSEQPQRARARIVLTHGQVRPQLAEAHARCRRSILFLTMHYSGFRLHLEALRANAAEMRCKRTRYAYTGACFARNCLTRAFASSSGLPSFHSKINSALGRSFAVSSEM